jgi:hypothetical protein
MGCVRCFHEDGADPDLGETIERIVCHEPHSLGAASTVIEMIGEECGDVSVGRQATPFDPVTEHGAHS